MRAWRARPLVPRPPTHPDPALSLLLLPYLPHHQASWTSRTWMRSCASAVATAATCSCCAWTPKIAASSPEERTSARRQWRTCSQRWCSQRRCSQRLPGPPPRSSASLSFEPIRAAHFIQSQNEPTPSLSPPAAYRLYRCVSPPSATPPSPLCTLPKWLVRSLSRLQ